MLTSGLQWTAAKIYFVLYGKQYTVSALQDYHNYRDMCRVDTLALKSIAYQACQHRDTIGTIY